MMVNYIAQLNDLPLSAGQIVTMVIIVTASSMGSAGIPSAGPATTIMILQTVGLPITDIGILFTIEWLVDRYEIEKASDFMWFFIRFYSKRLITCVNVLGDTIGTGIINHLAKRQLEESSIPKLEIANSNHDGAGETNLGYKK